MILEKKLKDEIIRQAEASAPNECCGFILSNKSFNFLFECENRFGKRFQISPTDFLNAKDRGVIEAIYHSHPDGQEEFSELDKKNSLGHGIKFILYSLKSGAFKEFGYDSKYKKYLGRFFEIGREDCFSLARDFYQKELDIKINDYERGENWTRQDYSLLDLNYEKENFIKASEIKKYDLIIFKSLFKKNFSGHIGIYLGDSLMLHNQTGSFSKIEEYSKAYKKLTNYVIRRKELV